MSLYDDIDTDKKVENVSGWASGIKFLNTHMQLKKAATTQPKRDVLRKQTTRLGPVINLNKGKSKDDSDEMTGSIGGSGNLSSFILPYSMTTTVSKTDKKNKQRIISNYLSTDPEWQFDNEYDPLYPNDYEKALKDMRDRRDREAEEDEIKRRSVDEKEDEFPDNLIGSSLQSTPKSSGVTIAPPASLSGSFDFDRDLNSEQGGNFGLGVGSGASAAARIMAKYGYKEGQGLGKKEQGMATALQVEKISHRTGRIIHEKDVVKEPLNVGIATTMGALVSSYMDDDAEQDEDEFGKSSEETSAANIADQQQQITTTTAESAFEEPLRTPGRVVLLKNMVGPGEVDDDLEPEVKEECQQKYGGVLHVTVFQMPDVDSDDAIRIFVEFERVESALKAVADLNGRFFGGRQVKANFYGVDKYNNLELTD